MIYTMPALHGGLTPAAPSYAECCSQDINSDLHRCSALPLISQIISIHTIYLGFVEIIPQTLGRLPAESLM